MTVHSEMSFDHWNQSVHTVCGCFETRYAWQGERFVGKITSRDVGGLGFADIQINSPSIRRQRGNSDRGDDRYYFLVMQREGVMHVRQDHDSFVLQPGELALFDSAQSFEMQPQGLIHQLSVHLERDAFERLAHPGARRFGKVASASLNASLLRGVLEQLLVSDVPESTDGAQGRALQEALISLLVPSLYSERVLPTGRPLRQLAQQLIDFSLPECPPPAELAARLNISLRQLYRHFEAGGESVGRYIQRQRLERSARELLDSNGSGVPITTIAYKWGFYDSAHYSNLFKQHYGVSPKAYRNQVQR